MQSDRWTRKARTLRRWWLSDWFPFFSLAVVLILLTTGVLLKLPPVVVLMLVLFGFLRWRLRRRSRR